MWSRPPAKENRTFWRETFLGNAKTILLISQGDLTRLLYCGSPHNPFRWLPSIPPDHHPSGANASWTVTSEHRRNNNLVPCTKFPQGCRSGEGWYCTLGVPTDSLALPKEVSHDCHVHSTSREIFVDFASASDEGQILGQDAAGTNDPSDAKRRRDDAPASPTSPVAKDADQAEHVASTCSLGASQPPCTTETHRSRSIRIHVGTTLVARSCARSDRNSIFFAAKQL